MKTTIRTLAAISLAAVAAAAVSCKKPSDEPTPPDTSSIELLSERVEIGAQGGEASVGYRIPVETSIEVIPAHEWVNSIDTETFGTIRFNVDANPESSARECNVVVKYPGAQSESVFKVVQAAKEDEDPELTFTISYDIDGLAVTMSVSPSDAGRYYYFDAVEKSKLSGNDYESLLNYCTGHLEAIFKGYESWGYTTQQAISDFCSKGEDSFKFPDLESETDYCGFAFGVGDDCKISSEIGYEDFKTGVIRPSDNVITIEVTDITTETAVISITPSNDDQYTFLITYADDFAGMADEEILMMLVEGFELMPVTGKIESETVGDLEPQTNYVVYAFGYQGGQATTGLFKKEFTTPSK